MQSGDSETTTNAELNTVEDKSRRTFLKAAVAASAAVVVAGGAAGFAIASGKAPTRFLSFVGFAASGSCIDIIQGGKFGPNNPNNFLQVDISNLDSFGTASSTPDGNGNFPVTFTRCGGHTINFTLTDKNSGQSISGTLIETGGDNSSYSYKSGTNGDLYLGYTNVTGDISNQFPAKSCLTLSCS